MNTEGINYPHFRRFLPNRVEGGWNPYSGYFCVDGIVRYVSILDQLFELVIIYTLRKYLWGTFIFQA